MPLLASALRRGASKEHKDILDAVRSHDCDLARRLMQEHILQSRAHVLRIAAGDQLS